MQRYIITASLSFLKQDLVFSTVTDFSNVYNDYILLIHQRVILNFVCFLKSEMRGNWKNLAPSESLPAWRSTRIYMNIHRQLRQSFRVTSSLPETMKYVRATSKVILFHLH